MPTTTSVSNWGNYPKLEAIVNSFKSIKEIKYLLKTNNNFIARGNGRCYGDSSLHSHILSTTKYNNILAFDSTKGLITCQAGVSFDDLIHFLVPKGFFLPVTPGTKFITVGGAVASDIHGKNHHQDGSFGRHIVAMDVLIAAGEVVTCSNQINSELFNATCGGMGLTGIILQVTFSLKRISSHEIDQVSIKARNLEEVFKLFEEYKNATYSVAWIDCLQSGESLGRSILMVGEHSDNIQRNKFRSGLKFSIPFNFPSWVLNKWSIKIFNFLFYVAHDDDTVSIDDDRLREPEFFYRSCNGINGIVVDAWIVLVRTNTIECPHFNFHHCASLCGLKKARRNTLRRTPMPYLAAPWLGFPHRAIAGLTASKMR